MALAAVVVVAPMLAATFGPADDHQIPWVRSLIDEHGFGWVVARWMGEANGRFRPLYWPIYFGEMEVWGNAWAGYVVDRLALVLLTLTAGYAALRLWFPPTPAALGAVILVAGPQAAAFWMLGSQEAWAVPLSLAAVALVGRGRYWGLGLAVLAAYIKEPFIVSGLLTVAWAWWRGARLPALVAGLLVAIAGVAWIAAMARFGPFYSSGVPLAGRYLYPAIYIVAFGAAWLALRHRWAVATIAVIGLAVSGIGATVQANRSQAFAAFVDELREDGRPVLVTIDANPEPALALSHLLPTVAVDPPIAHGDGVFASVGPDCIEVAMAAPRSVCPTVVRWP